MNKLKFFMITFFVVLILSFPVSFISRQLFSILLLIEALIIAVCLYWFVSGVKIKKIGKIRVEFVQYPLTYVLRAYTKPHNLWIVYDEGKRKFRAADWGNLPIRVILVTLFGIILLYTAYLIWFTLFQVVFLILFRALILFLFLVIGLYSLSVGLYRLFSLKNEKADKVCKFLNKKKFLINLIKKGMLYVHITPNFLIKEGFVTSVEFILLERPEDKKLEKALTDTARLIQKL
ncbi:MAG: hypothetical protein GTN40_00605 [Candidatus Aenigmarchaeota archaeon]|nr:hypothetical protein [Candidatus Aenigmarchaeota archaeon]